MLNFASFTDPTFPGQRLEYANRQPRTLQHILQGVCDQRGIEDWRKQYGVSSSRQYWGGLRRLLTDVGVPYWLEYTCGLSWASYGGIDVYVKGFVRGMPPPLEEAWFVLNTRAPVMSRTLPPVEQWYLFRDWYCRGQRTCMDDHLSIDPKTWGLASYEGGRRSF